LAGTRVSLLTCTKAGAVIVSVFTASPI
jgi:hypothetical protein